MWVSRGEWLRREAYYEATVGQLREHLIVLQRATDGVQATLEGVSSGLWHRGDGVVAQSDGSSGGSLKYHLTPEAGMYRIVATRAGHWGPAGTRGGLVANESILDQEGECWIDEGSTASSPYSSVTGDARVIRSNLSANCVVAGKGTVFSSDVTTLDLYGSGRVSHSILNGGGTVRCAGAISRSRITGGSISVVGHDIDIRNSVIDVTDHHLMVLGSLSDAQLRRHSDLVQIATSFGVLRCYRIGEGKKLIQVGCQRLTSFDELRAAAHRHCGDEEAFQLDMLEGFIAMVEPLTQQW